MDFEAQSGKFERIAVLHRHEGVFGLGASAEMDGGAATVPQFQMAGNEVGVEMGEEDVADLKAECLGIVDVLLDIALGVDDDGGGTGLVSEQIGGVGQAAQVVLFQNHRNLFRLPRRALQVAALRRAHSAHDYASAIATLQAGIA